MPKALLRFLLSMLIGMALVPAASQANAFESACGDCCAQSTVASGCAALCAPALPAAQADEQSSAKPLGESRFAPRLAWYAVPARAQRPIPLGMFHPPGPPPYLSFGRLLL